MRAWGSADAVIAAVRDDAAAECERIERVSAQAIERLTEEARTRPTEIDGSERLAAVRRADADADAAEDWEDAVTAAADRDAWVEAIAEAGRQALTDATGAPAWLERLVRESVSHVPGPDCIVTVPHGLASVAAGWRDAIERATGRRLVFEDGAFAAGCIARSADGRVTFDNTVAARERRSRTEWRAAVARLYDAAIAAQPVEVA